MNDSLLIKNCKLYNNEPDLFSDILIEHGKISKIGNQINADDIDILDACKKIIAPGFIDVHIQGAGGADILDASEDSIKTISKTLAKTGTTSFLGTTVVKPSIENEHLKVANEFVNKNLNGANLLGFHLEGPFVNINKKGGLASDGIYEPSFEGLEEILEITGSNLKMMTIAPELPGNLKIIKELVENGIIASFGHSDATYEELLKGFDAGINHVTHIFNAMPPLHHRSPGPLAAIFENNSITAQIISDGHHIHPSIVNMIYKLLGKERCICITDGMHGIGLPEGRYLYNGKEYESKNGAARYLNGTLIGSTMSLGNIALKFKEFTGCTFETAIDSVTKNPAKLLGIFDRKGSIEIGKDADLVILNEDNSIFCTIVNGKIVYSTANV